MGEISMIDNHRQANIILTGFMGTGKSTVGRLLAKDLKMDFIDTDMEITELHGPIINIFESEGEDVFRSYEREISQKLTLRAHTVISTGGKLMLDPINAKLLSECGRVFCLEAPVQELIQRLKEEQQEKQRPLLNSNNFEKRIKELSASRRNDYAVFEQVKTKGCSALEVAIEIRKRFLSSGAT
jgi:shikimate kinase